MGTRLDSSMIFLEQCVLFWVLQNFSSKSTSGCMHDAHRVHKGFLLHHDLTCVGIVSDYCRIPLGFTQVPYCIILGVQWHVYGIPSAAL